MSEIPDDVFPVVVIGAGLAGLSAAVHLAARDVPPLLLELDTEWPGGCLAGGPANTFEHGDRSWTFPTEHGAHALWGGYDNMHAMLSRFLDLELRASEGEEWINRWGSEVRYVEAGTAVRRSWLPAPLHYLQLLLRPRFWQTVTPLDILSIPGFINSLLLTTGFDPIREEIELEGLKIDDYFRFWTPNLRATFRGLGHSLLASHSEYISLSAFIAAIRFFTLLRRDTWRLDYLPGSAHDCVLQPLIQRIEDSGGMAMLGTRALSLSRRGDYWDVRVEDARLGGTRSLTAASVIFACDPPAAKSILEAGPETGEIARTLRFPESIQSATARLWFAKQPREGAPGGMFTGDFEIDNFFWLHRLHDEFQEWAAAGGSAIETHFYSPERVFDRSDQMLLVTATTEVTRAFPELRGHFVYGSIRRNGYNMTRFLVPGANSLHVETPWPGVYACGDWVGYDTASMWMERSTITGIAAANAVLAAQGRDLWDILPDRPPEPLARAMGTVVRSGRRIFSPLVRVLRRR